MNKVQLMSGILDELDNFNIDLWVLVKDDWHIIHGVTGECGGMFLHGHGRVFTLGDIQDIELR